VVELLVSVVYQWTWRGVISRLRQFTQSGSMHHITAVFKERSGVPDRLIAQIKDAAARGTLPGAVSMGYLGF
jgi:hypothetical protein